MNWIWIWYTIIILIYMTVSNLEMFFDYISYGTASGDSVLYSSRTEHDCFLFWVWSALIWHRITLLWTYF
jgi:hypothetical protein